MCDLCTSDVKTSQRTVEVCGNRTMAEVCPTCEARADGDGVIHG